MNYVYIYNQGIIELLCKAVNVTFNDGLIYKAYINFSENTCKISSGITDFYKDKITPEIIKVIHKLVNREI